MKKIFILVGLVLVLGLTYYIFSADTPPVGSTELKISYVGASKHNSKDLSSDYSIKQLEWFILRNEEHVKNWEESGYVIPKVNFKDQYLIMSKFKILRLYKKPGCDECLGVPEGQAIFDKTNSDKDFYYFYVMPKILLSQGVG